MISWAVLPFRSVSSGGKRMSIHASASAGIRFQARLGVSIRARLTVVRHASSVAARVGGQQAGHWLRCSLISALSPRHGYAAVAAAADGAAGSR